MIRCVRLNDGQYACPWALGLPVKTNPPQYWTMLRASWRSPALNVGAIGVPLLKLGKRYASSAACPAPHT